MCDQEKTTNNQAIPEQLTTELFKIDDNSEVVEKRTVTKSQKGTKASVERKVGECHQGIAIGPCSKGDSCSFSHDKIASGNSGSGQTREGQSSSPAPNSRAQTDGKIPSKSSGRRGESRSGTRAGFRAEISSGESVRTRHVIVGTLPCVSITSLNHDAHMAKKCRFRHVEADGQPSKESTQRCVKDQLPCQGVHTIGLRVSRFSSKSILRTEGLLGSTHAVKLSKGTWHQKKIIARNYPKV